MIKHGADTEYSVDGLRDHAYLPSLRGPLVNEELDCRTRSSRGV